MPVKGGSRLKAHIAKQRRAIRTGPQSVTVGFHGAIAPLARQLEFGNPATNLPERPAFRRSNQEASKAFVESLKESGQLTQQSAAKAGKAAAAVVRASYLGFRGPGLSEIQKARKEGTAGANRELVGHRGPKLVEHLGVEVDGVEVP